MVLQMEEIIILENMKIIIGDTSVCVSDYNICIDVAGSDSSEQEICQNL